MALQDLDTTSFSLADRVEWREEDRHPWPVSFRVLKRSIDLILCLLAAPFFVIICLALFALNPFLNQGPLFFRQERMGQGGRPFVVWKFRTMTDEPESVREHDGGVEDHRITPLGAIMRQTRLDELPNFINVIRGDMSVIGPRPDMIDHALVYSQTVPRYAHRFRVRPGITGLAQIRHGYVETVDGVLRKARNDNIYIARASLGMDLMIALQTVRVMLTGHGAR